MFQESPKLYEELVGVGRPFLETTIYFFLLQESGEKDNLVRANKLMHLEAVAASFQVSSGLLIEEIHLSIGNLQFMPLFKFRVQAAFRSQAYKNAFPPYQTVNNQPKKHIKHFHIIRWTAYLPTEKGKICHTIDTINSISTKNHLFMYAFVCIFM